VVETANEVAPSSTEDEEAKDETAPSVTELLLELGRDVSVLVFCETQLAASRNLPEVRRTARDITSALVAVLAFLTAFVFANVAAMDGLTTVMSRWLAALVLCAGWLALGAALTLALMVRAGQVTGWKWWRVFREGPEESLEDLERARGDAEEAVRETLARLAPAMTVEIASASVAVAGDMAGGVVDVGEDLLDSSDEIVDAITEELPAGSVVNQVWDVVLMPGRFGVKAATTVLRRGTAST
jgi:multidrug efflux pump subunit AcrB